MSRIREFVIRVLGLLGGGRSDSELERELEFHLQMEAEENCRRGLEPGDALRLARIRLGGIEQVKQEYRTQRSLPFVEERIQDLRFAWRSLKRTPVFTLAVILVGSLGIGANTAIFSLVNQVLLSPLPYPAPDRLGLIVWDYEGGYVSLHNRLMWDRLRESFRAGELAAAGPSSGGNLITGDRARYVRTAQVSRGFFPVLGVLPFLGRSFTAAEDSRGGEEVILLSFRLWRDLFAEDPQALGRKVRMGGQSLTLIGVLPEGFETFPRADAWVPLRADSNPRGAGYNYRVLTRLGSGWGPAREQLRSISTEMGREWSENNSFRRFRIEPYQTELTGTVRPALFLVMGAVGLVLLLAIANVSCLLLARGSTRRAELATRLALGGSRARILRQMLTESLCLGVLSGAVGVLLGALLIRVLPGLAPFQSELAGELRFSWPVLGFAFLISCLAGLLFGCAPAWQALGEDPMRAFQGGAGRGSTGRGGRFRKGLVICEVGICVVLLVMAGLLLRTFINLRSVDPGFDSRHLLTAKMSMQGSQLQSAEAIAAFYRESLQRIEAQPGVGRAVVSNNLPVEGGLNLPLEMDLEEGRQTQSVDWRYVSPGFFEALGIPLRKGRLFEPSDDRPALPVMIVNEAFRDEYFSGKEVLQQRVAVYPFAEGLAEPERVIVGVVGNVKSSGLVEPPLPTAYVPVEQVTTELLALVHQYFQMNWVIQLEPGAVVDHAVLQEAVRSVDPLQPFSGFRTMAEVLDSAVEPSRTQLFLLSGFALVALLMAMAGVYGLMSFQVSLQSRELGIRVAVGAAPLNLLLDQLRSGMQVALAGLLLGCGLSLLLVRLLESFLFGVQPIDPGTFVAVAALVVLVSILAGLGPARRATRVDPVAALT